MGSEYPLKEKNLTLPNQLNKEIQNPTARWIFQIFFAIRMVYISGVLHSVTGVNSLHFKILDLLGDRYRKFYKMNVSSEYEKILAEVVHNDGNI